MNQYFNLYYLHWWTLTFFIFESQKYHSRSLALVQSGGGLDSFQEIIDPVEQVQMEWHAFVRQMKADLAEQERQSYQQKRIPKPFPAPDKPASFPPSAVPISNMRP